MQNTDIGWAHHTFSPWKSCCKVSEGCKNCYAEPLSFKFWGVRFGPNEPRIPMSDGYWKQLARWDRAAAKLGEQHRVFVASMCDVFDDQGIESERKRLWDIIRTTPNLIYMILTKRSENIAQMLPQDLQGASNVWLGVSVELQKWTVRIEHLLAVPAVVHFVSYEPILGSVDFTPYFARGLNWLIAGGESGKNHRPMFYPSFHWACQQAIEAGCALYVKQDSGPEDGMQGRIPDDLWAYTQHPA